MKFPQLGKKVLVFAASALIAAASASAQNSISIRRIETPPAIDGVFSSNEWSGAAKTELAFQKEPQENDKPTERTEVFLAYDQENLYIAFYAFDSNPAMTAIDLRIFLNAHLRRGDSRQFSTHSAEKTFH